MRKLIVVSLSVVMALAIAACAGYGPTINGQPACGVNAQGPTRASGTDWVYDGTNGCQISTQQRLTVCLQIDRETFGHDSWSNVTCQDSGTVNNVKELDEGGDANVAAGSTIRTWALGSAIVGGEPFSATTTSSAVST